MLRNRKNKNAIFSRADLQGIKSGQNVFFIGAMTLLTLFLVISLYQPFTLGLKRFRIGDIASRDIIAQMDFDYEDKALTENARNEAESKVSPVYEVQSDIIKTQKELMQSNVFDRLRELIAPDTLTLTEITGVVNTIENIPISDQTLRLLIKTPSPQKEKEPARSPAVAETKAATAEAAPGEIPNESTPAAPRAQAPQPKVVLSESFDEIEEASSDVLDMVLSRGILLNQPLATKDTTDIRIRTKGYLSREPVLYSLDELLDTKEKVDLYIEQKATEQIRDPQPEKIAAVKDIVGDYITSTLVFDSEKTDEYKDEARRKVKPVMSQLRRGMPIVNRFDSVTEDTIAKYDAYRYALRQLNPTVQYFGYLLMLAIVIMLFGGYLRIFAPQIIESERLLLLLAVLIVGSVAIAKVFSMVPSLSLTNKYLAPVTIGGILATLLLDKRIGLAVLVTTSILASVVFQFDTSIVFVILAGGLFGIYSITKVRHRSDLMRCGAMVLFGNTLVIFTLFLIAGGLTTTALSDVLAGIANGVFIIIATPGLLYAFEHMFKITTDFHLLELSDLNHPLLKELFLKEPGTYTHSLMVANLAEAAADAIHANGLLCRVGAYFHDIGKMETPQYFTENQTEGINAHDQLNPSLSSKIIVSHVKEGARLVREYQLPEIVLDFVQQHHGTNPISFFYQQAAEQSPHPASISQEDYRYPGPKPRLREISIVMLADAAEAFGRSLKNPTPQKIRNAVDRIISARLLDGQLDNCDLTLRELDMLAENFTKTLMASIHKRVAYPKGTAHYVSEEELDSDAQSSDSKPTPANKSNIIRYPNAR